MTHKGAPIKSILRANAVPRTARPNALLQHCRELYRGFGCSLVYCVLDCQKQLGHRVNVLPQSLRHGVSGEVCQRVRLQGSSLLLHNIAQVTDNLDNSISFNYDDIYW